jgi:hypothetical protein
MEGNGRAAASSRARAIVTEGEDAPPSSSLVGGFGRPLAQAAD